MTADATAPSASSVIRRLLTAEPMLPADDVIQRVRAEGVEASEQTIRNITYNIRTQLKKKGLASGRPSRSKGNGGDPAAPKPGKRSTGKRAKRARNRPAAVPAAAKVTSAPAGGTAPVFATVAQVNAVVAACGGLETARQVVDAVRACGGVDGFVEHLDLLALIRTGK